MAQKAIKTITANEDVHTIKNTYFKGRIDSSY